MTLRRGNGRDDTGRDGRDSTRARCGAVVRSVGTGASRDGGSMQAALARPKGNVCIFDVSGMSRGSTLSSARPKGTERLSCERLS